MSVIVYKKKQYVIYDSGDHYIVHNKRLNFENHHTHITRYNTCRYIIDLALHNTVPNHLSDYLLVSLIKISDDIDYINKIEKMLSTNHKGRHYKVKRNKKGKLQSWPNYQ